MSAAAVRRAEADVLEAKLAVIEACDAVADAYLGCAAARRRWSPIARWQKWQATRHMGRAALLRAEVGS